MKKFRVMKKSWEPPLYAIAEGFVIGDEVIKEGDVFNKGERLRKTRRVADIVKPPQLMGTFETHLEVIAIKLHDGSHRNEAQPKQFCRLWLQGTDNFRARDQLIIM